MNAEHVITPKESSEILDLEAEDLDIINGIVRERVYNMTPQQIRTLCEMCVRLRGPSYTEYMYHAWRAIASAQYTWNLKMSISVQFKVR